jgi:hypothetical protein
MTLDPLSVFSVACNVLQILETSPGVLGWAAECYKSGSPDEVSTIIGNVHTIQGLNNELTNILTDPLGKMSLSSSELRLVDANEKCLRLSGDFAALLDSLKVTKKSVWRSIGVIIESMRFSLVHQAQLVQISEQLAQFWEHWRATCEARQLLESSQRLWWRSIEYSRACMSTRWRRDRRRYPGLTRTHTSGFSSMCPERSRTGIALSHGLEVHEALRGFIGSMANLVCSPLQTQ